MFLFNKFSPARQIIAAQSNLRLLNNGIQELGVRHFKKSEPSIKKKIPNSQHKNGAQSDYFDWNKMRDYFLNKKKCDEKKVNEIILDYCENSKKPIENVLSYVDYLKAHNLMTHKKSAQNFVLKLFTSQAFNGRTLKTKVYDSKILKL